MGLPVAVAFVGVMLLFSPAILFAQEADGPKRTPESELDPRGKPNQKITKVQSARYFVWHDNDGWHLRTSANKSVLFGGSIKLSQGSFGKMRTVGLESRGKPDRWALNAERTELRFEIHTSRSFDGFDFDVKGRDATIEFSLRNRKDLRPAAPKQIYIGSAEAHPKSATFQLPATQK